MGPNCVKDVLGLGEREEAVAGGFLEGGGVLFSPPMTVEEGGEADGSDQTWCWEGKAAGPSQNLFEKRRASSQPDGERGEAGLPVNKLDDGGEKSQAHT